MAKKKLFGNTKEPRCETCAHGKLSANGESVLCIQGGALPPSHSCRRYQYDPLRRVPKRRPLLGEYSAADFALDEQTSVPAESESTVAAREDAYPVEESTATALDRSTFNHLFEYLNQHETPDADTILAILNKTHSPESDTADAAPLNEDAVLEQIEQQAAEATAALDPDDSLDIGGDLDRLDMAAVPAFALTPIGDDTAPEPLLFPDQFGDEVVLIPEDAPAEDAPLSADDLLFLPKGTPSDHDDDDVGGGFTPLTGDE